MAQIRKRGNTYTISVLSGTDMSGKKIMKHTTYMPKETTPKKIEKEVAAFAADFESKVKAGIYLDGEKMKVKDFIERWDTDYASMHLTARVHQDYTKIINHYILPAVGNIVISKVNAAHLQRIYTDMLNNKKAPATIRKVHAVASSIFSRACKWGVTDDNVCRRVELPKLETGEILCFDSAQASRFLKALSEPLPVKISGHECKTEKGAYHVNDYIEYKKLSTQFQTLFNLALFGGFRRGELIALTWNDVDFENKTVSINKSTTKVNGKQVIKTPKTKAGYRTLTLPDNCMNLLKKLKIEQRELKLRLGSAWEGTSEAFDNNNVFINAVGGQMGLDTPYTKLKSIISMYNSIHEDDRKLPEIRFHDLRHSNATLLISQHVDINTVSNRLGHSKTSVTLDIYAHALKEMDEKASSALDDLLNQKHA